MKEDSFQHNLTLNITQERFQPIEKQKVKIQRRKLKEKNQDNKNIRPSIRLNLKKLPKDWFTPRKSIQKSTSRQTIETDRCLDTQPSNNPESQYSSERLITSNDCSDELQRTSHFGESIQSPTMIKRLGQNQDSFYNDESRESGTLGIESSPFIEDSNDQKFLLSPNKKQFTIDLKNVHTQQRSQEFDLTFSNHVNKGKSFSVKRVLKKPVQQKTQRKVSQFHIQSQQKVIPRNVSQRAVSLSRGKETFSNLKRKVRMLSKQQKQRPKLISLQNTQEFKRTLTRPYFMKDSLNKGTEEVFHKLNELHLPPIAKIGRH